MQPHVHTCHGKIVAVLVTMAVVVGFPCGVSADPTPTALSPSPRDAIPDWARPGAFRYLRLDGGPAAAEKARLSEWPFTAQQCETLAGLYTVHRQRVLKLLAEAHVNWVWLTWSVGFSWEGEAQQRRQCAEMMAACKAHGIHVTAYMTGNNMFWHKMFRNDLRTVNWLRRDEAGLPITYFGKAERFLAQMDHPEWIALQKRRLKAAVEAGAEAFFFDNCDPWRSGEGPVVAMSQELRRYARVELHSPALIQLGASENNLTSSAYNLFALVVVLQEAVWRSQVVVADCGVPVNTVNLNPRAHVPENINSSTS